MQEGYWTAGIDIGVEVTQVSYMTEGMTDPVTLDTLFETGKDISFIKDCILAIPGLEDPALLGGIDIILPEFTLEAAEKVKQACITVRISVNPSIWGLWKRKSIYKGWRKLLSILP